MKIPFTIDEFLNVFEKYNQSIWPGQILLNIIAVLLVVLLYKHSHTSNRIISIGLGLLWLWMGVVYHIVFFSPINPAAKLFGLLFVLQSILFFYLGVTEKLSFQFDLNWRGAIGVIFIFFSLVLYPLAGFALGHMFPKAPTFGVPCPTTIFTFGLLMFAKDRISWYFMIIPFLWSLVGFSAALNLGIFEDYALVLAGAVGFCTQFIDRQQMVKPGAI